MNSPLFQAVLRDVSHHPWAHLMDERDGMYSHYCAWERWVEQQLANAPDDNDEALWYDEADTIERVDLFLLHCDQADALDEARDV